MPQLIAPIAGRESQSQWGKIFCADKLSIVNLYVFPGHEINFCIDRVTEWEGQMGHFDLGLQSAGGLIN